jgi:hypothetical protein
MTPDPAGADKQAGQARAAEGRQALVLRLRAEILDQLLRQPDHVGPVELATPPAARDRAYPHRGRWVGGVVSGLRRDGLLAPLRSGRWYAAAISTRRTRHRGLAGVWTLPDPQAARVALAALRRQIAALPVEPRQRELFLTTDHPGHSEPARSGAGSSDVEF